MEKFDVCIIGGGPSGYAAAMRAIDLNKKVLLVEKENIGGNGLYNGALSSKTFWEISKDIANTRRRIERNNHQKLPVNFKEILDDVRDAIFFRKIQLETHLLLLQRKREGLFTFVQAAARLKGSKKIELQFPDKIEDIEADYIVLATGSRPRKLPDIPIDEKIIVTSDGIESFREFPESMVVLGAGVIGCEWATIFSNFGETKVFLIDKANRILPFEDEDISFTVEANLEENGVTIHRNSSLVRMEIVNGKVEYELKYHDGITEVFQVEKALVSVGRVPNVENLGLEDLGIILSEKGKIEVDDTQTSVPNIYAVGDISGDYTLVSVGELEGRHAIEKIFGLTEKILTYNNISNIMFLNPETACVGMNELQAKRMGICYKMVSLDYSLIPRAIAMRSTKGFFKILVTQDSQMKILGMRAVGEHASSAIQAVALLMAMDKGIEELAELIHPHPSIIEGIQECVRMLKGKPILKPEIFKDTLRFKGCNGNGETYDVVPQHAEDIKKL
jgi:dihydrolipoamide dehydrogenase